MQLASLPTENSVRPEKKKPYIKPHEELNQGASDADKAAEPDTQPVTSGKIENTIPPVKPEKSTAKETEQSTAKPEPIAEVREPSPGKTTNPNLEKLRSRRLSLNHLMQKQEEKEQEKAEYTSDLREKIDEENLQEVWEALKTDFDPEKKGTNTIVYAALSMYPPSLKENAKIELLVDNKAQQEELNMVKSDLLEYLRKKLRNGALELEVILQKNPKERKAYTQEEKFMKMAEKNPLLLKLKQELDLDFI